MAEPIEVTRVHYHRNGVGGEPFHVVQFIMNDEPFFAVVFDHHAQEHKRPENPRVAVFNQSLAGEGNFVFGENSWRGDCYATQLYKAIEEAWPNERP